MTVLITESGQVKRASESVGSEKWLDYLVASERSSERDSEGGIVASSGYGANKAQNNIKTRKHPGGGETIIMPPTDGSSTVAKIEADLRPSADGSAVRTSLVAGGG